MRQAGAQADGLIGRAQAGDAFRQGRWADWLAVTVMLAIPAPVPTVTPGHRQSGGEHSGLTAR